MTTGLGKNYLFGSACMSSVKCCTSVYLGFEFGIWDLIFLHVRQSLFVLAVLENSVLPMCWDSSFGTLKVTSVVYNRYLPDETKNSEWHSDLMVRN